MNTEFLDRVRQFNERRGYHAEPEVIAEIAPGAVVIQYKHHIIDVYFELAHWRFRKPERFSRYLVKPIDETLNIGWLAGMRRRPRVKTVQDAAAYAREELVCVTDHWYGAPLFLLMTLREAVDVESIRTH